LVREYLQIVGWVSQASGIVPNFRTCFVDELWQLMMVDPEPNQLTQILDAAGAGDVLAADKLLPLVYQELRRLAAAKMAHEAPGQTLQPTALVHEAWLRLSKSDRQQWRGRDHFLSAAAEAMRRILVENARRKKRLRHGGGLVRVDVECPDLPISMAEEKCLIVNDYLEELAAEDPVKAQVVKLRVFAGLRVTEIAVLLGCSEKTVQRHWNFARAWLSRALRSAP
jgi:RNA polymerase sigma factor (TIGR02999 family)